MVFERLRKYRWTLILTQKNMLLIIDTLNTVGKTIKSVSHDSSNLNTRIWILVAIIEFVVILFLLLKKKKTNLDYSDVNQSEIKKMKNQDIDMDNLMNSITHSKELYKELSKKCHPDRFVNTHLQEVADKLFQEITANQRNHKRLTELKKQAQNELNINF